MLTTVPGSAPTCSSAPLTGDYTFSYNGDGLRVSDNAGPAGNQNFVYDTQTRAGQPLIIEDGSNAYLYGPSNFGAGTAPLEQISLSTGTATYLTNTPSGVASQFAENGVSLGTASYSAYGVPTVTSGTMSTPFGFQGGYTDPDGLIYLINRYYNPKTGEFGNVDPLAGATGQPYAAFGDDPANAKDPQGQSIVCGPDACPGNGGATNYYTGTPVCQECSGAGPQPAPPAAPANPALYQFLQLCSAFSTYCQALETSTGAGLACLKGGPCATPTVNDYVCDGAAVPECDGTPSQQATTATNQYVDAATDQEARLSYPAAQALSATLPLINEFGTLSGQGVVCGTAGVVAAQGLSNWSDEVWWALRTRAGASFDEDPVAAALYVGGFYVGCTGAGDYIPDHG